MIFTIWFLVIGVLFIAMAMFSSVLKRLPLTSAMFYLAIGIALGPMGFGLFNLDPVKHAQLLKRISEVAVLISLFTTGLKLRMPLTDRRWQLPARLAVISMILTVGLITLVGVVLLRLPLGVAILLGAILSPTDPVLASDVQVEDPGDQDRLRFSLTGEAGLNDGTAFPFVMLGLALIGLHGDHTQTPLQQLLGNWFAWDVVWAIVGGLGSGWLLGMLIGNLVVYLRREYREATGLDDFLALGLVASYGIAVLTRSSGFLAVFAAGLALRRVESRSNPDKSFEDVQQAAREGLAEEIAIDPQKAPAYMAQAVLDFNEQLERICEVGVVLLVGGMLSLHYLPSEAVWFVPLLLIVIRPVSVLLGLIGSKTFGIQRGIISWFGIRGIGSVYYLMYAVDHGLPPELAQRLAGLTLAAVAVSIVVHGISVTPLMRLYSRTHAHRFEQTGNTQLEIVD